VVHPRIALSGLGSIARQHALAAQELGVDVIAFDPAADARAYPPGVTARVMDFDGLLEAAPDALIIASPDEAHVPQLTRAVERGIVTLVEKPLAPSVHDAIAVASLVESTRIPVLMGYVLRHRASCRRVAALLQDGAIGEVITFQVMLGAGRTITAAASRFEAPQVDRLYRDYSHEWDYLRWFFGEFDSVYAVPSDLPFAAHQERPNAVDGLLKMDRGFVGAFHLDYLEPIGVRVIHILGSQGSLRADFVSGVVRLQTETEDETFDHSQTSGDVLGAQMAHLLEVSAGAAAPAVTIADGLAALRVTEALIESALRGRWIRTMR